MKHDHNLGIERICPIELAHIACPVGGGGFLLIKEEIETASNSIRGGDFSSTF